ncbi:Uncharacterized protein FWK35_00032444 [Aphis craccivora]|uniref:Uncharacterized protein n=1 Tax=Aphis craccivora TaxID=307492 RepID=A0A6G0YEV3_APHCR|nr:Uncharacterized protein FWK35_00032444 [Aphis craccivora]
MGVVSCSKMNLVGALKRSFFEFPNSFQKRREKPKKKIKEKREFLRNTSFRPNRFFLYGCNSKTNHCKFLKFSPNIYVKVIYIQLNFQKILTFFDLFIDHRNFRFF